jgi:leader peptidase (prepilin peptidase)/N-methyltransferase
VSSGVLGAVVGLALCAGASPYLARLTRSAADRADPTWWRGRTAGAGRLVVTATVAAILGALAGGAAGWSALLPAFVLLALTATPLVLIDFEQHRLPNRLVLVAGVGAGVLLSVAALVRHDLDSWLGAVEGAAAVFTVLLVLALAAPRSFGLGDVKLGGVLGGYLGWFGWSYVYYGIFAGFLLGAVVAIVLLATRRASLKTAMAFGPMLITGTLLVLAFDLVPDLG